MNIYKILKEEHDAVKDLMRDMLDSGVIDRENFRSMRSDLELHMDGEENFLYPELQEISRTKMMAIRSSVEHGLIRTLLGKVDSASDMEHWTADLEVLYDMVGKHTKEEEKEVFDEADEVLDESKEREIRSKYEQMKAERTIMK